MSPPGDRAPPGITHTPTPPPPPAIAQDAAPDAPHPAAEDCADELFRLVGEYLADNDIALVRKAYRFGREAHAGQTRASGEAFITHPVQVAQTIAQLRLDATTIVAGMLHDVIEDTPVPKARLEREFGARVANIVDGVSKIDSIERKSRHSQASNFQKMMLAMARELRVILVKLADRLHNMRTLGHLHPRQRRRIARETLEIYTPIAGRLGMDKLKRELEDLSFKHLYPTRYRILEHTVAQNARRQDALTRNIRAHISEHARDAKLDFKFADRRKSLYSIYRKMRDRRLPFAEVFDVLGVRVVVSSNDDCYRMLGIAHGIYKPIPGKFKDYIAIPKENGYQSLHTALFGPGGLPIEIQIRTTDMDAVAEDGIAAHASYKHGAVGGDNAQVVKAREWIQEVTEIHRHSGNSLDFMESVRINLAPNNVYVFTPGGDILELPRGASALDCAFAVHSEIGLGCAGARIDNRMAPLSAVLKSGQTVEIITSKSARPIPGWLGFAVTGKARAAIRSHLKKMRASEAAKLGRKLLDDALARRQTKLKELDKGRLQDTLDELGLRSAQALFREIGLGNRMPQPVAQKLAGGSAAQTDKPLEIGDTEGVVLTFARCCHPIPGDKVVGVQNPGRGLVVHRKRCPNLKRGDEKTPLVWAPGIAGDYRAALRIDTRHERGVLATIADKIARTGSNIVRISFEDQGGDAAHIFLELGVKNTAHLDKIVRKITNALKGVTVSRVA